MPVVQVIWVEGKGEDVKRAVSRDLVASISKHAKIDPKFIHVAFEDVAEPEPRTLPYSHTHRVVKP